jgi:hypothetical protein
MRDHHRLTCLRYFGPQICGGHQTDLLAQAPLRSMMKKAESRGLTFRSEVALDGDALTGEISEAYN